MTQAQAVSFSNPPAQQRPVYTVKPNSGVLFSVESSNANAPAFRGKLAIDVQLVRDLLAKAEHDEQLVIELSASVWVKSDKGPMRVVLSEPFVPKAR